MASSSESHGTHDLNFPVEPMTKDKALEAAQARAEAAERERDEAKQAVDAFSAICAELGVERDNEAGLQAAHDIKARVKEMEEALIGIDEMLPSPTLPLTHAIKDIVTTALKGGSNG